MMLNDRIGNHIHYVWCVGSTGKFAHEECECGSRRIVYEDAFRGRTVGTWGPTRERRYYNTCNSFADPIESYLYKVTNGPPDPPRDNLHEFLPVPECEEPHTSA